MRIETIGDLSNYNTELLQSKLGKVGIMLQEYARGHDTSSVMEVEHQ